MSSASGAVVNRRHKPGRPFEYKCVACDRWKAASEFSDNQLRKGKYAALLCREHSTGPILERRCEGPCGHWKPLSSFSGNSRKEHGRQISPPCLLLCITWSEAHEGNFLPMPAPDHERSFDECHDTELRQKDTFVDEETKKEDGDEENNIGSDHESVESDAMTMMATMSLVGGTQVQPHESQASAVDLSIPTTGSSLLDRAERFYRLGEIESQDSPTEDDEESVAESYLAESAPSFDNTSNTGTVPPLAAHENVSFNVWGPGGDKKVITKARSVASASTVSRAVAPASTVTRAVRRMPQKALTRSNGWAKPSSRKTVPKTLAQLDKDPLGLHTGYDHDDSSDEY